LRGYGVTGKCDKYEETIIIVKLSQSGTIVVLPRASDRK
jgi:hypothetical protein